MKAISIKCSKAGELLAKTTFLMVICWSLVPALYWQISSKYAAVLIALSFLGILLERKLSTKDLISLAISYLAAVILTFYVWYFVRRHYSSPMLYVANGIIVWYPVVFAKYLLKINDRVYNKSVFFLIVMCLLITGITTMLGQLQHPTAARLLAGAGEREALKAYSRMNIGGYSYVYAAVLAIPYLMFVAFYYKAMSSKVLSVLCIFTVVAVSCAVYLSQYFIAISLLVASISMSLFSLLLKKHIYMGLETDSRRQRILFTMIIGLLLSLFLLTSVILLSSSPVQTLMHKLGQSILVERSNSFEIPIIAPKNSDIVYETMSNTEEPSNSQIENLDQVEDKESLINAKTGIRVPSLEANESAGTDNETAIQDTDRYNSNTTNELGEKTVIEESPKEMISNLERNGLVVRSQTELDTEIDIDSPDTKTSKNLALQGRIDVYMRPIMSFYNSPWVGNLLVWQVSPSGHSELIDALLCGGFLGATVFCILLYIIFRGLFSNMHNNVSFYPLFLISFLAFLALSIINTITHGKEIILIACLSPTLFANSEVTYESTLAL